MKDNLQDLYTIYLKNKTAEVCEQLKSLEWADLCSTIIPTPVNTGFRNRAKFKIFHENDLIRIMGTDPIHGEVPAEESAVINGEPS